jgi:hypothetical protein
VFGVALFLNRNPIFPIPLLSLSVCNAVMTNFIASLTHLFFLKIGFTSV